MSDARDAVPAAAIRHASAARGHDARQTYVVHSSPERPLDQFSPYIDEHLAYYERLLVEGKVYSAGPIFSEDGDRYEGAGMIVLDVGSPEEARAIAEGDVLHREGLRSFRITPWLVNHRTTRD